MSIFAGVYDGAPDLWFKRRRGGRKSIVVHFFWSRTKPNAYQSRDQRFRADNPYPWAFPQQLPGPAQPACPGLEPQQAVSPGPGIRSLDPPEKAAGADSIFLTFPLPQLLQRTFSLWLPTIKGDIGSKTTYKRITGTFLNNKITINNEVVGIYFFNCPFLFWGS